MTRFLMNHKSAPIWHTIRVWCVPSQGLLFLARPALQLPTAPPHVSWKMLTVITTSVFHTVFCMKKDVGGCSWQLVIFQLGKFCLPTSREQLVQTTTLNQSAWPAIRGCQGWSTDAGTAAGPSAVLSVSRMMVLMLGSASYSGFTAQGEAKIGRSCNLLNLKNSAPFTIQIWNWGL